MRQKAIRPHAVAMQSMSKEALIKHLSGAWDRIEALEAARDDDGYSEMFPRDEPVDAMDASIHHHPFSGAVSAGDY